MGKINRLLITFSLTAASLVLHLGAVINQDYTYHTQGISALMWVICTVLCYSTTQQYMEIRRHTGA